MIDSLLHIPQTSPDKIFFLRESSFAPDLFIAAVSYLDFFNRLKDHPGTLEDICDLFDISERPADVMLTLFKAYGFIKEENGIFSLTRTSLDYLTNTSAFDLSSFVGSLKDRPICIDMLEVLKTGQPASWAAKKDGKKWEEAMGDREFAKSFSSAMNSRGAYLAGGLSSAIDFHDHRCILDIGGGSGIYSIILCSINSRLKATIYEQPPVHLAARQCIASAGLDSRIDVASGDMFGDSLPEGYDIHLISHVLHDWDIPDVRKILGNSYRSLASGGILIIHDAHISPEKNGPLSVAEYSVLLMFLSRGKCYSVSEMSSFLETAGFASIEHKPAALNRSVIVAVKP
ncbi:MAG: methyltransferase domain-containing protein [Spirochaetales bacterium]|nr:methyltransferase domain-containing protein [Spirochaetales bacterium]